MAIHDFYYASPPKTYTELRWRLQVIAELGVGRLLRREQMAEDEKFREAMRAAG